MISTDDDDLKWFMPSADDSEKFARWQIRFFEFGFNVVHRTGIKNRARDALSRFKTEETDKISLNEELPVFIINQTEKYEEGEMEYFDQDPQTTSEPETKETLTAKKRNRLPCRNYWTRRETTTRASR